MIEDFQLQPRMNGKGYQIYLNKIDFILDALGEMTAEQMRRLFTLNSIKGATGHACGCPVAVYMRTRIGRKVWIESNRAIPIVGLDTRPLDVMETDETRARALPLSVIEFVRKFDSHDYPELVIDNA